VRGSVRGSVGDSVRGSVRGSVWGSVWDSVWGSVWDSVWDSVWAYISSIFHKKSQGENKFQSCIDLWEAGYIPSFDGKLWRLHCGKDAEIVWEGKLK